MERTLPTRIHPLMAVAALSLTMVSLVGAASIAGLLPNSRAAGNDVPAPVASVAPTAAAPVAPVAQTAPAQQSRQIVEHRTVVHHSYAQAKPAPRTDYAQQAPAPAPVAQNSPVGIGLGAVVGGLIGNQVGSGKGRTLATIAGVVGGGYVGNEIAKKNQQQ
jgi:uncharacterized protein YcfJ